MKEGNAVKKNEGIETREKKINIVSLRMVKEPSLMEQYPKITSPSDVISMLQELIGNSDREHFGVICMDTKNQPTYINIVSIGTLNSSLVHPREVFKAAIISNSASIIVFHNHPSGNTSPSDTDIEMTKRLMEVGSLIGIELLDHIIVSDLGYLSMKEKNML